MSSGVSYTNILQAAFAPIFFCQKITQPNCNLNKAAQSTVVQNFVRKMLMKLTTGVKKSLIP